MMDLWATVPYYTAYLSRALLANGADVTVGSISYYLDPACFSSRGLKLDPGLLNVVGRFPLPKAPRRILKLLESLLNLAVLTARFLFKPPDIVHVQYLPMLRWPLPLDAWFVWFCQKRGSAIVLTVHDLLPHDTAETYKRTFQHLYRKVDAVICHSDHIRHRLETEFGIPLTKISVIPHGPFFYDLASNTSDPRHLPPEIPTGALIVLWQGIIFPYKGLDLLLDAWSLVEGQIGHAWLIVAGTGSPDLLETLQQQVARLGLKHVHLNLRFISAEELVSLYRAADIVVYPYRAITTSGALATGLALGKTIVASDLPVFRELLHDRVNALLINPHQPGQISAALIELAIDSSLRRNLAAEVSTMNFGDQSWSSIAVQTMRTYRDILLHVRML